MGGGYRVVLFIFAKKSLAKTERCAGALWLSRNQKLVIDFWERSFLTASLIRRRVQLHFFIHRINSYNLYQRIPEYFMWGLKNFRISYLAVRIYMQNFLYKYTMMYKIQQNFIIFIIVLGQYILILVESSSGPSKIQILWDPKRSQCKRLVSHSAI